MRICKTNFAEAQGYIQELESKLDNIVGIATGEDEDSEDRSDDSGSNEEGD